MSTSKSNATTLAILSIRDTNGEVHQNGTTSDTSVTVAGRAEPGKKLKCAMEQSRKVLPLLTQQAIGYWS